MYAAGNRRASLVNKTLFCTNAGLIDRIEGFGVRGAYTSTIEVVMKYMCVNISVVVNVLYIDVCIVVQYRYITTIYVQSITKVFVQSVILDFFND